VKRSRKAAEELADLYRGNLDAFVEAGKIAATGAQALGQNLASKSRDSLEQTANTVRSFAEAKSPTELLQLQSDFARTAFDRFVEESSALTESFVKLAGEAFQPISNRASANVERFNQIAA
jgi:phasin family protein